MEMKDRVMQNGYILILPIESKVSRFEINLTEDKGTIVKIAPDVEKEYGLKVGDVIRYKKNTALDLILDEEKYKMVHKMQFLIQD